MSTASAQIAFFIPLAIIIAYYDVRYRRIPNPFVLATFISGVVINGIVAGLSGVLASFVGCAFAFILMFMLHVFGAMGAGIGALIDFGIRGYSVIGGPPLASPNARRVSAPVALLDELWLRVRQGDTIDVVTTGGRKVTGKFVQVSRTSVTLMVGDDHREIPSSDVGRVRRAGNRYRSGALWGGAIFGAMGLLSSAGCSGGGCGNPLFVGMFTGTAGVLWGAAIGAAIPKHPVVYEAGASSALRLIPMMGPHRIAVAFTAKF